MWNPFNFGNPVSPHQMVGRWDQIEAITYDLINPGGHSHIVIGGRRFGKSSFLEALQYFLIRQLDQTKRGDWYVFPILINLKRLTKDSPEGVFGLIVNILHKSFDPLYASKILGVHFNLEIEKTKLYSFVHSKQKECSLDDFSEIIDELLSMFSNSYGLLRLIFLIDEIEVSLDKDWTEMLFSQLRSLIYEGLLRNYIRYVIAGSSQVIDVREKGSPLLNMLKVSHLETLEEKEILKIINRANDISPEIAKIVLEQCGGHPFIAQYLMYHIWEDGASNATESSVIQLANRFTHERYSDLEQWLLDIGKAGQLAYGFLAESNNWLSEAQIRQLVNNTELKIGLGLIKLCYHGLVNQDGTWSQYHFAGKLFKDWFANNALFPLDVSKSPLMQSIPLLTKEAPTTAESEDFPSCPQTLADTTPDSRSAKSPQLQDEFRYDAFISYSHKDSGWIHSMLLPKLEQEGLHICIDYRDFQIGIPSLVNMENAIDLSRKILLILTPNWVASEWTKFESLLLLAQDPTNLSQRILPILVQLCPLPKRLEILTHLDLTKPEEFDRQVLRLVSAIHGLPLT